ncbi:MAG TPA: N-acetylmuramoyl-L-alanine amidase, partial [Micavibrio sp.]
MPSRCILAAILFFALLTAQAGQAMALDVLGIRMGPHPDRTRLVVELSAPAAFRSFILTNPTRLVIDMPSFEWRAGKIDKPQGTRVSNIRQGMLQQGVSRIVIDLTQQMLIRNAFLLPRKDSQPDRLVIDFAPAPPETFAKKRNAVFGNLNPEALPAQAKVTDAAVKVPLPPSAPRKPPADKANRPLIVIDAGHGGEDPGALGGQGLKEKNITLSMARDLKKNLEATGRYRVSLTRDKDVFIRLS